MKNKVLIVCASLLLLIFLSFGTFCWYLYFKGASAGFNINNNNKYLETTGIIFQDNGNNLYDATAESVDDNSLDSIPSYDFQVTNTRDYSGSYNLYIEDLPVNAIDDGCTEETLLTRKDLKYQLTMNNKIIKEGFMETIKDNILDSREIEPNQTNNYSLKIYIHDEALNWFGKHYHYKLAINK